MPQVSLVQLRTMFCRDNGTPYANFIVLVSRANGNDPIRLFNKDGRHVSREGLTMTGNDGYMDVWVADDQLINITLLEPLSKSPVLKRLSLDPNLILTAAPIGVTAPMLVISQTVASSTDGRPNNTIYFQVP